jgi:hypothetical protein
MKSECNSASVYFARTGCEITSKAGHAASARFTDEKYLARALSLSQSLPVSAKKR